MEQVISLIFQDLVSRYKIDILFYFILECVLHVKPIGFPGEQN